MTVVNGFGKDASFRRKLRRNKPLQNLHIRFFHGKFLSCNGIKVVAQFFNIDAVADIGNLFAELDEIFRSVENLFQELGFGAGTRFFANRSGDVRREHNRGLELLAYNLKRLANVDRSLRIETVSVGCIENRFFSVFRTLFRYFEGVIGVEPNRTAVRGFD